jgi:hypothetical protein
MSKKPTARPPDRHQSVLVALRLAYAEKELMVLLIERTEGKAGMVPGTLSAAAFARSAVLDYMARQLAAIETGKGDEPSAGPGTWEVIRRGAEILRADGAGKKRSDVE